MSYTNSNVTSGFIDLATFDEIEKYMYGGPDATAYFVRETRKSTWFTQVPVVLTKASGGTPDFGSQWSAQISRAGDYLLQTWLRLDTPLVQLTSTQQGVATGIATSGASGNFTQYNYIRWTRNFMHNLIQECTITFNDLVAARFDNYHLDFWSAFTVPASKRVGYDNMVGNIDSLILPNTTLTSATLNLPLPFFYSRDSGVALPTAALPYNDMRINFNFRNVSDLLIGDQVVVGPSNLQLGNVQPVPALSIFSSGLSFNGQTTPNPIGSLSNVNVWANYAIVSNDERKRMACAPRDILMEQVQTAPVQSYLGGATANTAPQFDIRFSHAIKVLFFNVRNKTNKAEWSNYTTASPAVFTNGATVGNNLLYGHYNYPAFIDFEPPLASDPIADITLVYENTQRLAHMDATYFSLVNPWYCAPTIPIATGYHSYSYSLDFINLDPQGSTNYGKLTNVSVIPTASTSAKTNSSTLASNQTGNYPNQNYILSLGSGVQALQTFEFITTCVNNNIIRVSGGALGKHGKPKIGRRFNSCGKTIRDKRYNYHQSAVSIC